MPSMPSPLFFLTPYIAVNVSELIAVDGVRDVWHEMLSYSAVVILLRTKLTDANIMSLLSTGHVLDSDDYKL